MFEIQGLLSDEQIDKVRIEGYEVEVTADAVEVAKERWKEGTCRSSEPENNIDEK